MADRRPIFNQHLLYDTTPLPSTIPSVRELGTTSAPLLSASFFIGARCRAYNDDFMQCKTQHPGRAEQACLREGRRVTRCASSVIGDMNAHCLAQFRDHWECLENNNQQLWQCRPKEWKLNRCVFDHLKLEKTIPEAQNEPVHLRQKQRYAHTSIHGDLGDLNAEWERSAKVAAAFHERVQADLRAKGAEKAERRAKAKAEAEAEAAG